jgi:hypothetical protein
MARAAKDSHSHRLAQTKRAARKPPPVERSLQPPARLSWGGCAGAGRAKFNGRAAFPWRTPAVGIAMIVQGPPRALRSKPDRMLAPRLANRVSADEQTKIYAALHARIPMVTAEEQRAIQAENAQDDLRFWDALRDMNASLIDGHKGLIATAEAEMNL